MSTRPLLKTLLPYAVRLLPKGMVQLVNRGYMPLGQPVRMHHLRLKSLEAEGFTRYGFLGEESEGHLFLYHDGNDPCTRTDRMDEYMRKLRLLAESNIDAAA